MKHKAQYGKSSENEGKAWGQGQYANMPQEVKMSEYPKKNYKMDGGLNDTMVRLDGDSKHAERGYRKNLDRGMY